MLPEGFGVARISGADPAVRGSVTWTDAECRFIELTLWSSDSTWEGLDEVGPWLVVVDQEKGCSLKPMASTTCLEYRTPVEGGELGVQAIGPSRAEGDAFVRSIPLGE